MKNQNKPLSLLHSFLSLIFPGLGQTLAGYWQRGLGILFTMLVLGSLSAWTVGQRARFPEFYTSVSLFMILALQALALLLFLAAIRYLLSKYLFKGQGTQFASWLLVGIIFIVTLYLTQENLLATAGDFAFKYRIADLYPKNTIEDVEATLKLIFSTTAILAAGTFSALWLWQVSDAGQIGNKPEKLPSLTNGILIAAVLILSMGYNMVDADIAKAIREYRDTSSIMSKIAWPWRNAFEYEQISTEVFQKIQAPCPEGATGPESNQALGNEPWVSVSPTCGHLTVQNLIGDITYGTELIVTGGGFPPGSSVELLWKNPIGNAFVPRGVGETKFIIDSNGEFSSALIVPQLTIPSTSDGDQIHKLLIRQDTAEIFTGNLSREMKLALQGMLETVMIALMATFFGIILAFPVSFLAARNLMGAIISPMNRVVGNVGGLALGIGLSVYLSMLIGNQLGGFENSPIIIFLISLSLLILLSILGSQIVGGFYDRITNSLGAIASRVANAAVLATLFAGPGYVLGKFANNKIATISLGNDALINESLYAYTGLGIALAIGLLIGLLVNPYRETGIGMMVYFGVRTVMNIIRSIEPLIWAIVATIWIGLGPFAGTIALTLHTIAALGKLYSESIESIDPGPIEALQATGATRLQTIIYAVIPQVMPPFISFTIYRWDINVRMSTIIGMVGGGGIGFLLIQWIRQYQYRSAGLAVWLIAITVAIMDNVSSRIREKFV